MALVRLATVSSPFNRPALLEAAIGLLRHAAALGLLDKRETVDDLDFELVREIATEASAVGVGRDAALGILGSAKSSARLASYIERLDEALIASPLPERELRELGSLFDLDDLADLLGTSEVSLRRYAAGARTIPDELAERLHWLALVVGDLAGAYNEIGIRRWFERPRSALGGLSPRQALGREWQPNEPMPEEVRRLAAALAGVGAAT